MSGGPRFKVPAHIAAYSLLFSPAILFWVYYDRYGKDEEQLEKELKEKYGDSVRRSKEGNKNMAEFFNHAIRNPDGAVDSQLDSVLKSGKGAMKRHYAVDEKLYGTAEGVAERKRMEDALKKRQRAQRRKKRAGGSEAETEKVEVIAPEPKKEEPKAAPRRTIQVDVTQVAAVTVVAGAAALVGFLAGGSRR